MLKKIIKKILYKVFTPILNKIDSTSIDFEKRLNLIEKKVLESIQTENETMQNAIQANQDVTFASIQSNRETILANSQTMFAAIQGEYKATTASLRAENEAMFLWLLFGVDIKTSSNIKEYNSWMDYITIFNREREFNFFNSIPIEVLGDFSKDYNKCFVTGHFSNLVVDYLKKGHFLIPSTGIVIDTGSEYGHLAPVASIPYLMGNEELFLSCNPSLSNLLLSSNALFAAICEKTSELCVLPVNISIPKLEVVWGGDFSQVESSISGTAKRFWRWAIGFEYNNTHLTIYNNSTEILKVSLCFSLLCLNGEAIITLSDITGKSSSFFWVEGSESAVIYETELFSGKNDLVFSYEGGKHKIASDDRELKFCVANFSVISYDGVTLCSSLRAYDFSVIDIDKEIRVNIKKAGFYAISAEIIDNKGFYRKKLADSSFSPVEDGIFIEHYSDDIIRESAKTLGKLDLFVVYKCYRKCIPGRVLNL